MVEGNLASQQFVGQHAQAPQVHSHVVLHALEDLRSHVIEGAAVGLPPLVADGRPPKIAQLIHILTKQAYTLEMTIFSGLMSLCAIPMS